MRLSTPVQKLTWATLAVGLLQLVILSAALHLPHEKISHYRLPRDAEAEGDNPVGEAAPSQTTEKDGAAETKDPSGREIKTLADNTDAEKREEQMKQQLSKELQEELETSQWNRVLDPEHYYRAPGGYCNQSYVEKKLANDPEITFNTTGGNLTILDLYLLERGRCLFYTNTECQLVADNEWRCVCREGMTWEDGSCLAYHGQKCRWNSDCVRNAKCVLSAQKKILTRDKKKAALERDELIYNYKIKVLKNKWRLEEMDEDAVQDAAEKLRTEFKSRYEELNTKQEGEGEEGKKDKKEVDEDEQIKFELGYCDCHPFKHCQRDKVNPPNTDNNRAWPLTSNSLHFLIHIIYSLAIQFLKGGNQF